MEDKYSEIAKKKVNKEKLWEWLVLVDITTYYEVSAVETVSPSDEQMGRQFSGMETKCRNMHRSKYTKELWGDWNFAMIKVPSKIPEGK